MRLFTLALVTAVALPAPALADSFTTSELLSIADGGDEVDRLFLASYAAGLAQGVEMSHQVATEAGVELFCPTEPLSFGGELVLDVLREQVAWHPESAAMEPRVVFFTGLMNRYPCEEQLGELGRPR
jgi:hypothetical protein